MFLLMNESNNCHVGKMLSLCDFPQNNFEFEMNFLNTSRVTLLI
jgi:hypothetical protein